MSDDDARWRAAAEDARWRVAAQDAVAFFMRARVPHRHDGAWAPAESLIDVPRPRTEADRFFAHTCMYAQSILDVSELRAYTITGEEVVLGEKRSMEASHEQTLVALVEALDTPHISTDAPIELRTDVVNVYLLMNEMIIERNLSDVAALHTIRYANDEVDEDGRVRRRYDDGNDRRTRGGARIEKMSALERTNQTAAFCFNGTAQQFASKIAEIKSKMPVSLLQLVEERSALKNRQYAHASLLQSQSALENQMHKLKLEKERCDELEALVVRDANRLGVIDNKKALEETLAQMPGMQRTQSRDV